MIADQLGDSPRFAGPDLREVERQRLTDLGGEFVNILYPNQHMIQAATEAARSAANDGEDTESSFEFYFLPTIARSARDDPDATPRAVPIRTPRCEHVPGHPQPTPAHVPEVPVTSHPRAKDPLTQALGTVDWSKEKTQHVIMGFATCQEEIEDQAQES